MLRGFSRIFPLLLIISSSSLVFFEGKTANADPQKKHPVIMNPKNPILLPDVKQNASIKEVFSIEMSFSEPKEFVGILMDSKENIFVLDRQSASIKVFDKNGDLLHQFGGKGEESHHMLRPACLRITSQKEVLIIDMLKYQLNLFSLQGKLLRIIPFYIENIGKIEFDAEGRFLVDSLTFEGDKSLFVISRHNEEFDTTKRLVSLNVTDVFKKPELLYFGRFVDWGVMSDDKIVVGMSDKYVFHIYEPDGDLIKEFGKEYEPERISPEERNKEMNRAHPSAKDRIKEMVYHKPFHSFTIDNENRIIVRTWEKTEDGKNYFYDVFDPEGVYISRFRGNFSIKQWIHDQFLAVEDIPGGKSAVNIYRVIWK